MRFVQRRRATSQKIQPDPKEIRTYRTAVTKAHASAKAADVAKLLLLNKRRITHVSTPGAVSSIPCRIGISF